jgi:hypothetical protein
MFLQEVASAIFETRTLSLALLYRLCFAVGSLRFWVYGLGFEVQGVGLWV